VQGEADVTRRPAAGVGWIRLFDLSGGNTRGEKERMMWHQKSRRQLSLGSAEAATRERAAAE